MPRSWPLIRAPWVRLHLPLLAAALLAAHALGGGGPGTSAGAGAGSGSAGAAARPAPVAPGRAPTASQIWLRYHLDTADLLRLSPAGDWPRPPQSDWERARMYVSAEMALHRARLLDDAPDAPVDSWGQHVWEVRPAPDAGEGEVRLGWRYGCGALVSLPEQRAALNSGAHQFSATPEALRTALDRLMFAVSRDLREQGEWTEAPALRAWQRRYQVRSERLEYVLTVQALSPTESVACIVTRPL